MTQRELKKEIESTRLVLDRAIEEKYAFGQILEISRILDCLIEDYMGLNQKNGSLGQ